MMLNGSHIAYYHICRRKLWMYSQGVWMEDNSELVLEGRLLHETAYPERADRYREVEVESIKIDHYDPTEGAVREIKKSDKLEEAHIAQLKYYLYVLERNGIAANYGVLEYPSLRKTKRIELSDDDRRLIPEWERDIEAIIGQTICPPVIRKPFCKHCSYYEFCYVEEG